MREFKATSLRPISLFLAGGITDCPDWQAEMVESLKDLEINLYNPRRTNWVYGVDSLEEQVKWEHEALREADAILFWFPSETLCPITLFELGAMTMTNKIIFVGVSPEYKRVRDIEVQLKLVRPDIPIHYTLETLTEHIKDWYMILNNL